MKVGCSTAKDPISSKEATMLPTHATHINTKEESIKIIQSEIDVVTLTLNQIHLEILHPKTVLYPLSSQYFEYSERFCVDKL